MSQKIRTSVEIDGSLKASQIANATIDTDKFLVSDGGIVKYRTGSEMLSDLGVAPGVASNIQHQVKAGVAINKGQAVYVTGADGTNIIVGLASNTSEATSSKTLGLLNATVSTNGFADVVQIGKLSGLNTSTATIGDPVWLGTGGNLIYGLTNKPYAPAHLVYIGVVTRVNANNGEIFVKVQNGFELDELHDVDLKTTTKVNGHLLGYNGTLWVNKTIAEWLGYTPADDAAVVHKAGTETITGEKTFSSIRTNISGGSLTLKSGAANRVIISSYNANQIVFGVTPAGTTYDSKFIFQSSARDYTFPNATGTVALTSDLAGYVPTSRTITINGVTQDLSANRSWTVSGGVSGSGSAGQVAFWNGTSSITGESTLFWDSTNDRLGIGTTSPSALLNVVGASDMSGTFETTGTNNATSLILKSGNGTTSGLYSYLRFINNNTNQQDWRIGTYGNNDLSFVNAKAGTTPFIINTSGNVGIGTTSPRTRFSVVQDVDVSSITSGSMTAGISLLATSGIYGLNIATSNSTGTTFIQNHRNDGNTTVYPISINPNGGNVGIGTITPLHKQVLQNGDLYIKGNTHTAAGGDFSTFNNGIVFAEGSADSNIGALITGTKTGDWGGNLQFATRPDSGGVGFERMRITSGGNVGIGTPSPTSAKLQVKGDNGTAIGYFFNNTGTAGQVLGLAVEAGTNSSDYALSIASSLGTPYLRVRGDGNVGIGTTSPNNTFDVRNTVSTQIRMGTDQGARPYWNIGRDNVTTGNFVIADETSIKMSITNGGNVGIGTTDGSYGTLTVAKSSASSYVISSIRNIAGGAGGAVQGAQLNFYGDGGYGVNTPTSFIQSTSNDGGSSGQGSLRFGNFNGSSSVEAMRITSSGNVGIGTTTDAGYKLDVNGTGRFSGNLTTGRIVELQHSFNPYILLNVNSTQKWQLAGESSRFAIYNETSGTNPFSIATSGAATFSSSVTATGFFNSSDIRLKEIVSQDGDIIEFTWKDGRDNKKHIGVIAQEVQKLYPDMVQEGTDEEKTLSVNYIELLVLKNRQLEKRIESLEKLILNSK